VATEAEAAPAEADAPPAASAPLTKPDKPGAAEAVAEAPLTLPPESTALSSCATTSRATSDITTPSPPEAGSSSSPATRRLSRAGRRFNVGASTTTTLELIGSKRFIIYSAHQINKIVYAVYIDDLRVLRVFTNFFCKCRPRLSFSANVA
jgi:hypothetical protein